MTAAKVTNTGYKRDSPDVSNPVNVIPSNRITMKGVDFPVLGIDNLNNYQIMYPENDYVFQGSYVVEFPLKNFSMFDGRKTWANQTGCVVTAAQWGAGGQAASSLINAAAAVYDTSQTNKAMESIAAQQSQTNQLIAQGNNITSRDIASCNNDTNIILAEIKANSQSQKQVMPSNPTLGGMTIATSDTGTMIGIGIFMAAAVVGVFIYMSKK